MASLFALHRAGKTQTEIAQILHCNVSTVSRWLADLADTTELAKQRLKAGADTLAERIVKDGDVEQSLEVLDRLEVLSKRQQSTNATGVFISIGMPSHPVGPDPLTPGNHNAGYQTQIQSEGQQTQVLTAAVDDESEAKG